MEGLLCSLLYKTGLYICKYRSIECETFKSYFPCYIYTKLFTLRAVPVSDIKVFSEINVLSEIKVRNKYIR